MSYQSINPATGETMMTLDPWGRNKIDEVLQAVSEASIAWRDYPIDKRCQLMRSAAQQLRDFRASLATTITEEMGKLIGDSEAEIEKCALVCDYYAENGPVFLQDEIIESDAGKSFVCYQPLGPVLAVMPWNFPFWQVFRFAAPALVAGNTGLLKHASNVPRCAQAIEKVFVDAGFPQNVFRTLMISASQVKSVIEDSRVKAVTLTGSEPAGKQVASQAGDSLKKSVLELGGSDPFVVLPDANLELAVENAVISRYLNSGQSCIAAKRFIVVDSVAEKFLTAFKIAVEELKMGDPSDPGTRLAPMARVDLRDELHQQVTDTIAQGAEAVTGCQVPDMEGAYYPASILDKVQAGMRAYEEELFGPVAIVIRAKDEEDAIRIANDTRFGLGGSVWTRDSQRGENIARRIQSGAVFVNGFVKSDPRLPFGGIKASGYGRELSRHGIHEFVNVKTIWVK